MRWIDGFRLTKFRKFDDFSLELVDPVGEPLDVVVLAGPNGSGKTSVIEGILFALGREDLMTRDLPPEDRGRLPRAQMPSDGVVIVRVRIDGRSYVVSRTADRHEARTEVAPSQRQLLSGEALNSLLASVGVEYFSSRRVPAFIGPIQEAVRGRPPDDTEANRIWRLKNQLLQQQGRRANPRYSGPEPMDRVWLSRLNEFWSVFRPDGTKFALDVVDPENLEETTWELYLFSEDRRVCSVEELSSGELEAISLASAFVTRSEGFLGVLLFDEPELHFHREWQVRILPALRKLAPGMQIVAATHSSELWDAVHSFQRFLLVPNDDPRAQTSAQLTEG